MLDSSMPLLIQLKFSIGFSWVYCRPIRDRPVFVFSAKHIDINLILVVVYKYIDVSQIKVIIIIN